MKRLTKLLMLGTLVLLFLGCSDVSDAVSAVTSTSESDDSDNDDITRLEFVEQPASNIIFDSSLVSSNNSFSVANYASGDDISFTGNIYSTEMVLTPSKISTNSDGTTEMEVNIFVFDSSFDASGVVVDDLQIVINGTVKSDTFSITIE